MPTLAWIGLNTVDTAAYWTVMGDVITPPAAVTAVLLALVSLIRENRDLSAHSNRALAGGLLGAVAGLITVMVVAATGSLG